MAKLVCTQCGEVGAPKYHTPGSILIEVILWLCLLIPGLIYSIWRHSAKRKVCRSCRGDSLVKPSSPMGQKVLAEFHQQG
jgi:hypothetical protein